MPVDSSEASRQLGCRRPARLAMASVARACRSWRHLAPWSGPSRPAALLLWRRRTGGSVPAVRPWGALTAGESWWAGVDEGGCHNGATAKVSSDQVVVGWRREHAASQRRQRPLPTSPQLSFNFSQNTRSIWFGGDIRHGRWQQVNLGIRR